MKVRFYSEILDKYFDTKDDCFKAEAEVKAKKEQEHKLYQVFMKAKEDYEQACKNFYDAKKQYFDYVNNASSTDKKKLDSYNQAINEQSFESIFKYLFDR